MKNKTVVLCILGLFVTAACFAAGCGRDESKTFTTPGGTVKVTAKQSGAEGVVTVETKEGTATIKSGSQAVSEAQLGAPLYPGAQVLSSGEFGQTKGAGSGVASTVVMSTNDSFDKVAAFYKTNLKDVQQSMDQTAGDQKIAMFMTGRKGNMRNVQIIAKTSGGPTNIQITKIVEK
jgi:hypothetical protein